MHWNNNIILWQKEKAKIKVVYFYACDFPVELKLTNTSHDDNARVTVHTIQLLAEKSFRTQESYETLSLNPEEAGTTAFSVMVRTTS